MNHTQLMFIFLMAFVTIGSSSRQARDYFDTVERGDAYVDKFLMDMIEENGHEYDPYYLGDSVIGFWKKISFLNVSGEAKLHNGYITGLSSLHRAEHCTLKEENRKLHVKADLGAGVLVFNYAGSVKFMSMGPTITVHGNLPYMGIEMTFSVDSETGKNGVLEDFTIDDMRGMEVWITGLGPMNWALNSIISGVTRLFKGYIKTMIESKIENHVKQRLPNYAFPVEGSEIIETLEIDAPEEPVLPENNEALKGLQDTHGDKDIEIMNFHYD